MSDGRYSHVDEAAVAEMRAKIAARTETEKRETKDYARQVVDAEIARFKAEQAQKTAVTITPILIIG